MCTRQRLLDDVLRVVVRDDSAGVRDERGAVTADDLLEGAVVALADETDEARVGLAPKCHGRHAAVSVLAVPLHLTPCVDLSAQAADVGALLAPLRAAAEPLLDEAVQPP